MPAKKSTGKNSQPKKSKPGKNKINAMIRSGLGFPVGKIHKLMQAKNKGNKEITKIEPVASVYLAAVL